MFIDSCIECMSVTLRFDASRPSQLQASWSPIGLALSHAPLTQLLQIKLESAEPLELLITRISEYHLNMPLHLPT